MSRGAMSRLDANVGLAVTGIAGPGGGTEEKPVGYVCFCALDASGATLARALTLPGSRSDIRERSVVVALHMLRLMLSGEKSPL
jgi:nicotinamide-nucleotide amidase